MKFTPIALLMVGLLVAGAMAAAPSRESKGRRALPPKWPKSVADVFFPDAREKLVGERPNYSAAAKLPERVPLTPAASGRGSDAPAADGSHWSKWISAETLEDEVKALQLKISENVTTPAKFKGGGFKDGRRHFTELALLFAIISQYDGDVRWKSNAGGVRDLMARAGFNCKVGTDASYNEAKLRKDDLEQLVRGGSISAPDANPDAKWDKIADRPPLMQRLEEAQQQRIAPATANTGEFSKHADVVLREAELLAAIGEAISQEGFEFSDDETYVGYAHQMRDAALEIVGAVKGKDYESARAASGKIEKACSGCHEDYRS
jgi:hypothetical protein